MQSQRYQAQSHPQLHNIDETQPNPGWAHVGPGLARTLSIANLVIMSHKICKARPRPLNIVLGRESQPSRCSFWNGSIYCIFVWTSDLKGTFGNFRHPPVFSLNEGFPCSGLGGCRRMRESLFQGKKKRNETSMQNMRMVPLFHGVRVATKRSFSLTKGKVDIFQPNVA